MYCFYTSTSKQHTFADIHYSSLESGKYNIQDVTVDILGPLVMHCHHVLTTDPQWAIETNKENIGIRLRMLRATLLPQETANPNIYTHPNPVALFGAIELCRREDESFQHTEVSRYSMSNH